MTIDTLLVIIAGFLFISLLLTSKVIKELEDICKHLKGIDSKKIIAIADEPEVRSRSDEAEARICDRMKRTEFSDVGMEGR